jgi:DMSO/TMAO reductase YedYZ molybdopterin-dependent catalytic subunit
MTLRLAPNREEGGEGPAMSTGARLPPGQYVVDEFARFGLTQFARRFPKDLDRIGIHVLGDVEQPVTVSSDLEGLPRVEQVSDFHCVTTWSCLSLRWSGVRFCDFFRQIVAPRARPRPDARFVVLRCQDGYRASLPLDDLMADDVLLADALDGLPLTVEHGAPLRLVAPAHYGYKAAKHLSRVEFWRDDRDYRPARFRFMEHPRARVALEERGRGVSGRLLRYLYRPLVKPTASLFRRALQDHKG